MFEFMQLRWEESVPQISFPSAMDYLTVVYKLYFEFKSNQIELKKT